MIDFFEMNANNLKLVVFKSFLGAIANNVRAVAFDFNDETIFIYGYLDVEPKDEDYEIIDIAVTEIMAAYPQFLKQKIYLEKSEKPIGKLLSYKGWVFCRYEE
ncbi:hypothetical protein [Acinetobacter sp. ESBL14]